MDKYIEEFEYLLHEGRGCDRCRKAGVADADDRPSRYDWQTKSWVCSPACLAIVSEQQDEASGD